MSIKMIKIAYKEEVAVTETERGDIWLGVHTRDRLHLGG